jgi:hypothetical protein
MPSCPVVVGAIIRRHPRGDYLELTDDAQFSLAPELPHLSRSEH